MQNNQTGDLIGVILFLGFLLSLIWFMVFVWGTIFRKAGYSFWMALLMLIPLVNLIWILIFAFSTWPIQRELEMARTGHTGGFPVMPPPPR